MDRRQRKTRAAIFQAFTQLLSEKTPEQITVGQIIDRANVGRATFYAHFETKDHLIRDLCQELFSHIFAAEQQNSDSSIFACEAPDSVFLHLLQHLQKDDCHILTLLSCPSNDLFLRQFKQGMLRLVSEHLEFFGPSPLPADYRINHIAAAFVETVRWWIEHKLQQPPETVLHCFLLAVKTPPF